MTIIFYIFLALISLSVLVFFHELGHFTAAKAFGVKIERFSVGFGKIIFRKEYRGTEWAFSAIPLGGYVKMKGQDDSDPTLKSYDEDSYNSKKPWQRIIILLAGPVANLVLAFFVYLMIAFSGAPATVAMDYMPPVVKNVQDGSPAEHAGLKSGDIVTKVNNQQIKYWYQIGENIKKAKNDIILTVNRDGKSMTFNLQTKEINGTNEFMENIKKRIIGINTELDMNSTIDFSPSQALFYAYRETVKSSILIATGVKKMSTGEVSSENVGGALTIFDVIMKFAQRGVVYLLFIMALISVNLGILNLLPIPALDGGHIMFNLYEMITKKEPSENALYYLTLFGWVLLLGLMSLGMYNDINRMFG